MTVEPKPLAVGDRVRVVNRSYRSEPAPGTEWAVDDVTDTLGVWLNDPNGSYMYNHEVERIDPAPPADLTGLVTALDGLDAEIDKLEGAVAGLEGRVRTLTAERDAARSESRGLSAGLAEVLGYAEGSTWGDLIDRVYSIANERDAALARATRAEKLLATLEDRHQ